MQSVAPKNRHAVSLTHAFLNVHWDQKSPLLLGFSGGPDSKALLYSLLECGVKPHLAHVDHGWREESFKEAEELRREAEKLGCPFFTTRLNLEKTEDAARRGRLAFFKSIYKDYQALLLAHQADDLAETVLKRIFEGAHLSNLGGMEEASEQEGMTLWRPFLKLRKKDILDYLEKSPFIVDATNFDPKYLRSRMRLEIMPLLTEKFGKEIVENLTLLSERSYELKKYLDGKREGEAPIERRHHLLQLAREQSITLTREALSTLLNWIEEGGPPKYLHLKTKKILVDRGRVEFFSLHSKDSNSAL